MFIHLEKEIVSQNNNKIQLFKAEKNIHDANKTVLIIAVFHGDELEGEFLVKKLMEKIEETHDLIGKNKVLILPCLNPDGKDKTTRTNSNGVDLNRNFPTKNWKKTSKKDKYFQGDNPSSEIETKFMIEILKKYNPDRILSIHSPYKIINFDGPAKDLAKKLSKLNNYPVQEDIGYPTLGSFGTYAGKEKNIPVITLELPDNQSVDELWKANKELLYSFIS